MFEEMREKETMKWMFKEWKVVRCNMTFCSIDLHEDS